MHYSDLHCYGHIAAEQKHVLRFPRWPEKEFPTAHSCCHRPVWATHTRAGLSCASSSSTLRAEREQTCIHCHWPASTCLQLTSGRTGLSGSANSQHSSMSRGPALPTTASAILEDPRGLYETSTCSTHSFTEVLQGLRVWKELLRLQKGLISN